MVSRQLELGFENQPGLRPPNRPRGRSSRTSWWFEQMHGVVNSAHERAPAPEPQPVPRPLAPPLEDSVPAAEAIPRSAGTVPAVPPPRHHLPEQVPRWRFARSRRLLWE
jgi:hypothetical protein